MKRGSSPIMTFSPILRRGAILVAFLSILLVAQGLLYKLKLESKFHYLHEQQQRELTLKDKIRKNYLTAANLNKYRRQIKQLEESFGTLLRRLPDKIEIADLLVDISQSGLASGLVFDLFRPLAEQKKDFYGEIPLKIRVRGSYHAFGDFISRISNLPRIVTIENYRITAGKPGLHPVMEMTAMLRRYPDDSESNKTRHMRPLETVSFIRWWQDPQDTVELGQWIDELEKTEVEEIEPLPAEANAPHTTYTGKGLQDPFVR